MNAAHDFRSANERRIARMEVWIDLAKTLRTDNHVRFVFYWIAYEAGYKVSRANSDNLPTEARGPRHRGERPAFHGRVARLDAAGLQNILIRQSKRIRTILELRQAHPSFWDRWDEDEDVRTKHDWEDRFRNRVKSGVDRLTAAVRGGVSQDVARTLDNLFRNLNVVRNQIVHGGSAGIQSRGRTQVRLGAELLKDVVPRFQWIVKRHLNENWGMLPFPRVGDMADDKCLPPWLKNGTTRPNIETEHG